MNTITTYSLTYNGKETEFPTRQAAEDEQLFMAMMYNVHLPLTIVERRYVDEQLIEESRNKLA